MCMCVCVCVCVCVLTRRGLDIKMCSAEMSHMFMLSSGCVTLRAFASGRIHHISSYFINTIHAYADMGTCAHIHTHITQFSLRTEGK